VTWYKGIAKINLPRKAINNLSGLLLGILGTIVIFKDLILAGTYNVLWSSNYDTGLIYWIVNWGYHILFEETNPRNFWNANYYYPNLTTLAYTDSMLSLQMVFAPLRFLGVPSILALYLSLGATCVISCILTKYALDRTGYFSNLEAILITFSSIFCLSMISFFYHYQLFGFELALPFFLYLFLYLRDLKTSDLVAVCALFAVASCYSTYLAPILVAFTLFLAPPSVIWHLRKTGLRSIINRTGLKHLGIVLAFASVLYFVLFRPYIQVAHLFPAASLDEVSIYSANISSIINGYSIFSFWYAPFSHYPTGGWEFEYFPGYILLTGCLVFIGFFIYKAFILLKSKLVKSKLKTGFPPIEQETNLYPDEVKRHIPYSFILYISILFLLSIILSWGPYAKWNNQITAIKLPYYWLVNVLPGWNSVRAPGRLGMFIGLPLSVFLIFGVREFCPKPFIRTAITSLLLVGVFIESFPVFHVYPFSPDPEGIYAKVAKFNITNQPLLELPVVNTMNGADPILNIIKQLDGSTLHWGWLVTGYSSKTTKEQQNIFELEWQLQRHQTDIQPILTFAKKKHISYFLIHLDQYPPDLAKYWIDYKDNNKVCVLWEDNNTVFFRIGSSHCKES